MNYFISKYFRNIFSISVSNKSFSANYKRHLSNFTSNKIITSNRKMTGLGLSLSEIVQKLNEFASEDIAEKWDNVGLLIEPHTPRNIQKIMLTNDLTDIVMNEALNQNTDLIISYHPPIFQSLKRITQNNWKEKLVSICLENRIAVYSPHTAWDSISGGINDWLSKSFPILSSQPITRNIKNPEIGAGRLCVIDGNMNLKEAIDRIKKHLNLEHLQVSLAFNGNLQSLIKTVAICAGSGSSILKCVKADLYLTGEMSHHEVLDAIHSGSNVVLCNHSNSERGFLIDFQNVFENMLNNSVEIVISKTDCDPLQVC